MIEYCESAEEAERKGRQSREDVAAIWGGLVGLSLGLVVGIFLL